MAFGGFTPCFEEGGDMSENQHELAILWAKIVVYLDGKRNDYYKEEEIIILMKKFEINQTTATSLIERYLERE